MLADGFDHPSLGERLAHQERLRKEAGHPMGTEPQGYSKEARLRRQEGTIEYLTAELDALRDTFNEVQRTADRNHKRAFEAEKELSSLREAVERHRYNLPHEYKLVDGHTPSAEGCRTCAFLLAWDAAADPSPSPADPKGQG